MEVKQYVCPEYRGSTVLVTGRHTCIHGYVDRNPWKEGYLFSTYVRT